MIRAISPVAPGVWRIGQICLTVTLIVLIWRAADGPEIARTLSKTNLFFLGAAVAALICQTVLSACRWKMTAAELGQELPLRPAIREYFLSQAVNQVLPGAVLGDAARAVRARADVGLAVSGLAVGLERLAGQIAMFVTLACAFAVTLLWPGGLDWPPGVAGPVGLTIGAVILAAIVVAVFWRQIGALNAGLARWGGHAIRALFSPHILPVQIGLGITITICNVAAFGLCAWAVGVALPLGPLLAIVPLILFSMLIPLTVSGWGVREGSAALLLPLAGVSAPEAVTASFLFGVAMLIAVLPGLLAALAK